MTISWTDDRKELMASNEGGHTEVMPDEKGIVQVTMKLLTTELDGSVMPDAYANSFDATRNWSCSWYFRTQS